MGSRFACFGTSLCEAFVLRLFFLIGVFIISIDVRDASAQAVATPSPGCVAANAGDFDLSLPSTSALSSSPISATFAAGETLIFTLSAGGGGVERGFAEDVSAGVVILDSIAETSASYSTPADGPRDFNIELDTDDFAATVSVSCTVAPGSITILKDSGGVDGAFNFTGDLGAFTVTVAGESAPRTFSELTPGVYSVIETAQEGFELDDVSCVGDVDNGSVVDIPAGRVEIDLDPGENITCAFTNRLSSLPPGVAASEVRDLSSHAVRTFLYRRASAILSAQPERARLMRKHPGAGHEGGVDRLNVAADENGVEAEFAASAGNPWGGKFDVWIEGHYTSYTFDGGVDFDGDVGLVYLGVDYLISDNLLVGVLGQVDWASETAPALGEEIDGRGWMAGPYVSARLQENLFFDARAAWGRSTNDLTIEGLSVDDEFETRRWLASGALTGNRRFGAWRVTPSLAVVYFEEEQDSYVSRLGVDIDGQTVALGRASFEPEIAYQHLTQSGVLIEPQATLAGLWDFETPNNVSIPGWTIIADEFRLRAGGGVQIAWPNGFGVRVNGFYEGIGAENIEAYGARLRFDVPFGVGERRRAKPRPDAPAPQPQYKTCTDGVVVLLSAACPPPAPPEREETRVTFGRAKATLSPEAYAALEALWRGAVDSDIARILIDASGDGGDAQDQALAARRAEAVKAALIGLGAPDSLMQTTARSAAPAGEAQVTIHFQPEG